MSNCKIIRDKIFSIIGTLIVRARGYVCKPPASKLKSLTPPTPLIPSQKILLNQIKKDFAIEGLSCSNSATNINLLKYSNHGENQSYHYWCSRV